MSRFDDAIQERLSALRREFDSAFSERPRPTQAQEVDLLAVRVAGQPLAVRLSQVSGIVRDRRIVGLPSTAADLLGLCGIRGTLVPVFSLAGVLGRATDTALPRWCLLCGVAAGVALAFEEFEGYLRVPALALTPVEGASAEGRHVMEMARLEPVARPVISLDSILQDLRSRAAPDRAARGE
ncbi:MAG: chemotaxis protein CheW [Candidatus Wallbacteria bacterium]|nr:chemotaxis protein CheW [Candidatus Wallbacteria bacterium]